MGAWLSPFGVAWRVGAPGAKGEFCVGETRGGNVGAGEQAEAATVSHFPAGLFSVPNSTDGAQFSGNRNRAGTLSKMLGQH